MPSALKDALRPIKNTQISIVEEKEYKNDSQTKEKTDITRIKQQNNLKNLKSPQALFNDSSLPGEKLHQSVYISSKQIANMVEKPKILLNQTKLFQNYDIVTQVGSGSFGVVHKAIAKTGKFAGKTFAIKSIRIKPGSDVLNTTNSDEIKFLQRYSNHKNIVQLVESFLSEDKLHYHVVMEYMEMNLYHLILQRSGQQFSDSAVQSILYQLMDGIKYIHDCGYFHRDIKPENILITINTTATFRSKGTSRSEVLTPSNMQTRPKYILKIADFGLVHAVNDEKPLTGYVSTRWYRAPELLLRKPDYCCPIDIFAWGCVAFEITHLQPLFPASSEWEMFYMMLRYLGTPGRTDQMSKTSSELQIIAESETWDEGYKLAAKMKYGIPKCTRMLEQKIDSRFHGTEFMNLITKSLAWNPLERIKATEALNHPFFEKQRKNLFMSPSSVSPLIDQRRHLNESRVEPPRSLEPNHVGRNRFIKVRNDSFDFTDSTQIFSDLKINNASSAQRINHNLPSLDFSQAQISPLQPCIASPKYEKLPSGSNIINRSPAINDYKWVNYSAVHFAAQSLEGNKFRKVEDVRNFHRKSLFKEKRNKESSESVAQRVIMENFPSIDNTVGHSSIARTKKNERLTHSLRQSLCPVRANDQSHPSYANQIRPTSKGSRRHGHMNRNSLTDVMFDISRHISKFRVNRHNHVKNESEKIKSPFFTENDDVQMVTVDNNIHM